MKNYVYYFAAAVLLVAVGYTSCRKDKPVTLESIAVTTPPAKTTYTVDEAFNPAGMVVTATYSDGSKAPVTVTTTMISGFDSATPGAKTVTITYAEKGITRTTTVNVTVNAPDIPPSITAQPEDVIVDTGGTATFSVEATGTAPLEYEWQYSEDDVIYNSLADGESLSGVFTPTLTYSNVDMIHNGTYFRCIVSNDYGEAISNAATLTVTNSILSLSHTAFSWHNTSVGSGVSVTSNTSWTAESNAAWIIITSDSSGSGDAIVYFNVSENTTTATREGEITVTTTDGTKEATLTITQTGAPTTLTVTPATQNVPASDSDVTFNLTVDNNAYWYVVNWDDYDWVYFSLGSYIGTGNSTIYVDVYSNISTTERTATFTVESGSLTATFKIIQDGAVAAFSGDGTELTPYLIDNATDLNKLSELINAGIASYADEGKWYRLNSSFTMPAGNFMPIGTGTNSFKGNFDGNSKTITNLTVNKTTEYAGLFGNVHGGTIKNLGLANANIQGGSLTGGIAGGFQGSSITGCYVTGAISGGNWVGGIVGSIYNPTTVSNCYTTCTVAGSSSNVGGIAGFVNSDCTVSHCYATGAISGTNYCGGITGYIGGTVINCVALNPGITRTGSGTGTSFGRVAGNSTGTLGYNAAWIDMTTNSGADFSDGTGNGLGVGLTVVNQTASWTALDFVSPPWTVQNGSLPGLFGNTVAIPSYIH